MSIALMVEEKKWSTRRGLGARLKKAAALALARTGNGNAALTILLSSDRKLHALNVTFRGKDKPTNVLSFPAWQDDYLGDVALAYGVAAKEARAQKKPFADHATHLVVHGILHLLGYDHDTARAAKTMEPLEIRILSELGIGDPYTSRSA